MDGCCTRGEWEEGAVEEEDHMKVIKFFFESLKVITIHKMKL